MSENRTKKAAVNIVYNMLYKILTLILTFAARIVFIRVFGAEYLGLNGVFNDVLGFLSLADLGLNTAMTYNYYKPLSEGDDLQIAALTGFYKKIYYAIAAGIACIGLLLTPFLPFLISLDHEVPLLYVYYFFALGNTVVSYLFVYKTTVLIADQKNYVLVRVQMAASFIKTILQIVIILVFRNYIGYLAIGLIYTVAVNFISSRIAERRYPCIKEHALISKEKRRSIKNTIFSAFVFKISSVLLNATDNLLISVMIGTIAVGYYSNYHMIQTTVEGVFSLVFTSLTASIGNLLVKENAAKRYSVFTIEQDISFLICGIAVPCYTILVNDFIRLWIGSEYVLDKLLVASVGMNILLSFSMHPLWSFREASGLYRKTKWIMMICAAINLVLSVLLGKWMGTAGIIFASSISRISTYVWYEPKLLFRDYFEQSPRRYYLRLVVNFVFTVTETVLLLGITKNLQVYSWQSWFFKAVITVLASTAISFLFYRNSNGVRMAKKKLADWCKNRVESRTCTEK